MSRMIDADALIAYSNKCAAVQENLYRTVLDKCHSDSGTAHKEGAVPLRAVP